MNNSFDPLRTALLRGPFDEQQKQLLTQFIDSVSSEQASWLNGFITGVGITPPGGILPSTLPAAIDTTFANRPALTILYGSRSGHGEEIAENARRLCLSRGFEPVLKDMSQYPVETLTQEENMMVIVSTHGDGIPPLEAEDMHHYLHSGDPPDLTGVNFTVCALGDSSYQLFCQTGKDFDVKLEELGGKRIYPRTDCDVDFEDPAEGWIKGALSAFAELTPPPQEAIGIATIQQPESTFSKRMPFEATLLKRILLNGRGSQKETYHIELSLEGSGLTYEPGDALGVYAVNHETLVNSIIKTLQFDPHQEVNTYDGTRELITALTHMYELSVISVEVLKGYAIRVGDKTLDDLINNHDPLQDYLYGRDILDMITDYPATGLTAQIFVDLLRKMPARLYSIASSSRLHPNEVHLTVAAVRYELNHRQRQGVCSTFLADYMAPGSKFPIYIDKNKGFKLPEDPETPIIMVGPGTGVAPFRAFIEERTVQGGDKNWLFFSDQHFMTDFLYQLEWQRYIKKNQLRLDVAFSRDQKEKVYVQHRMQERSRELYAWLQEGAHFYVCGDERHMAPDVHQTLLDIFKKEGNINPDRAEERVKNMQKSKRYQLDVY